MMALAAGGSAGAVAAPVARTLDVPAVVETTVVPADVEDSAGRPVFANVDTAAGVLADVDAEVEAVEPPLVHDWSKSAAASTEGIRTWRRRNVVPLRRTMDRRPVVVWFASIMR
jgi:hypothetical protein